MFELTLHDSFRFCHFCKTEKVIVVEVSESGNFGNNLICPCCDKQRYLEAFSSYSLADVAHVRD